METSVHDGTPRVLIVDDSEVSRIITRREVRSLGFEILEAASGEEALEILSREACDAVLMDCQMPGLDGYETTRLLRSRERGACRRHTVVIALTGDDRRYEAEQCCEAGMDGILPKSKVAADLAATLAQAGVGRTRNETLVALERLGLRSGDDILGQVVASFLDQGPLWLAEIHQSLTAGDARALALAAHDLGGAAAILEVCPLGQSCAKVEELARRNELVEAAGLLPALVAAWGRAEQELHTLRPAVASTAPRASRRPMPLASVP
ncbi:MAG TPA: response regulator [Thermoanaerobaculia bacterium]|nr:response regulator [Thermoanaerobaculia bacterium]